MAAMESDIIRVRTGSREAGADITGRCAAVATAAIAIIELGSGSDPDLLSALAALLPADDRWQHSHGSRGHGRSHVMPAFVPPHATIPVLGGRLALGTWQSIALVDVNVDNPDRQVRLSFLPG